MDESQDYSGVYLIWLIFFSQNHSRDLHILGREQLLYEGESLEEVPAREPASFGGKTW